jgi:drug/metabolite transporter (DMT)-like permease
MIARKAPPRWQADLALALVAFVWGASFVVVKQALSGISIVYFLAIRFSLAAACLFVIFLPPFLRAGPIAVWRGLRCGAAAGAFLWLGYMLQTFGLKYTTAGKSGFLTGLYIVLAPLVSAIVYRRWPQRRELFGIAIASVGMILMTFPAVGSRLNFNRGDLLTIGCAVAYAFHLLVLGYFSQRELFQAVALGQILCAALLSTGSLVVEPPRVRWTPNVTFAILLTSVFATALAFALQTWGQKFTTATRTALIFTLEPVFALMAAVLVGHEPLTASAVVGGALILAGILAVELKPLTTT